MVIFVPIQIAAMAQGAVVVPPSPVTTLPGPAAPTVPAMVLAAALKAILAAAPLVTTVMPVPTATTATALALAAARLITAIMARAMALAVVTATAAGVELTATSPFATGRPGTAAAQVVKGMFALRPTNLSVVIMALVPALAIALTAKTPMRLVVSVAIQGPGNACLAVTVVLAVFASKFPSRCVWVSWEAANRAWTKFSMNLVQEEAP